MGPPPRACLFMTPARVPMSVPLLLEHVHGDPCPIVHAAVMSNRQRPGVRPRLRWRPRRCRQSGRIPGHTCGGPCGPTRHAARVPQGPSIRHVPLRTGVGVPDTGGRRASPSHREGAGSHLVGGVVPRDTRSGRTWASGRGPAPDHTFRSGPRGAEPAVRRPVRPLKRSARPPPAPGGGSRPRAAAGPLSRLAPGHRGHGAWADLPTPRCRPRRTRRRGGAVGKLAGIRRYLPARPLAPM